MMPMTAQQDADRAVAVIQKFGGIWEAAAALAPRRDPCVINLASWTPSNRAGGASDG